MNQENIIPLVFTGAALLMLLFGGWKGAMDGVFRSITRMLAAGFALLFSLRVWYLCYAALPNALPVPADLLAGAIFAIVFAVSYTLLSAISRNLRDKLVPVYPPVFECVGGLLSGLVTGAILYSAVLLAILPSSPRLIHAPSESGPLKWLEKAPLTFYAALEAACSGQGLAGPSKTPLPAISGENVEAKLVWK